MFLWLMYYLQCDQLDFPLYDMSCQSILIYRAFFIYCCLYMVVAMEGIMLVEILYVHVFDLISYRDV